MALSLIVRRQFETRARRYSTATAISTYAKMRADSSQNTIVSAAANATGNQEPTPGESKEEFTTVAPSSHTGIT